jgi:hypothetical protein
MEGKNDGNSTDEIEITVAMIEAGASVIFEYREEITAWMLAERIYLAMARAKRASLKRGC